MLVLIDNGHGGFINGVYQTPGKRSPIWEDGTQLFEGELNRAIVNDLIELLTRYRIPYVHICPELRDVTLKTRVKRANVYKNEACFFLSIHSNGGGGSGGEIFTAPGQTLSDSIASIFGEEFTKVFPDYPLRTDFSDGDLDKEDRFYVLTQTAMPAILTESFFMDNERECREILLTKKGRAKIVEYHIRAILRTKKEIFDPSQENLLV